jgi:FkbM family methyltransferase
MRTLVRKVKSAKRTLHEGGVSGVAKRVERNLRSLAARATGVDIDGSRFTSEGFPEEVWQKLVAREYEDSEIQTIKRYLDRRSPIVEIGGGLGVIACVANRLLERPRKHIVVEASPQSASIIRANADRNQCDLQIVNAAVAYGCDDVTFWVNADRPYSNALMPVHEGCREIKVPATTLGILFEQHAITNCSLVCDIEGGEYEMVKSELPVISEHVSSIFMETHPRLIGEAKTEEMLASLKSAGFETRDVVNDVYVLMRG